MPNKHRYIVTKFELKRPNMFYLDILDQQYKYQGHYGKTNFEVSGFYPYGLRCNSCKTPKHERPSGSCPHVNRAKRHIEKWLEEKTNDR